MMALTGAGCRRQKCPLFEQLEFKKKENENVSGGDLGLRRHAGAPFTHTCLLPVLWMQPNAGENRKDAN